MEFRFKTTEKYVNALEYLLRLPQSFYYNTQNKVIEIDNPPKEMVVKMMDICGECDTADELLAKEIMTKRENNVAG